MLIATYPFKKNLKENIGKPLKYLETSPFEAEYKDNGQLIVANRPFITKMGREWFAIVLMENGLIKQVN